MPQLTGVLAVLAEDLFIDEPDGLSLNRWNGKHRKAYPEGKHPSLNVYRRSTVTEIAERIGLRDSKQRRHLRLLLAFAAENVFRK